MNLLAAIVDQAIASAELCAGVTVRYTRGVASVDIAGVLLGKASDLADTADPMAPRIEHSDRDFLIRPEKIILSGSQVVPKSGDTIVILDVDHPAAGKLFEVLPPNGGRSYRSCEPNEQLVRIFTRQV